MAQRETSPLSQIKNNPAYFVVREGKKPVVYRAACDGHPHGIRLGEFQGQFVVCDEKGRVVARAADRLAEFQKTRDERLMFAVYEETSVGNMTSMKCYVYSYHANAEFEPFKDTI